MLPGAWAKEHISRSWNQYVALVDVAEENARLREELAKAELERARTNSDLAELARLRRLMGFSAPEHWQRIGTRVLAGRFGSGAALDTVMIDRGFATGAPPDTPLATEKGLVGKVYRASPHIATVILLTDQAFRVGVISEKGRVPGILAGTGARGKLDVRYMLPNTKIEVGELLVTSGLDGVFPKGLPVARITSVEPSMETLFPEVAAEPLVLLDSLEEALLLAAPEGWPQSEALRAPLPIPVPAREPAPAAVAPTPAAPAPPAAPQRLTPSTRSGGTDAQRPPRNAPRPPRQERAQPAAPARTQ